MDPDDLLSNDQHPAIPYHQEMLVRDHAWQLKQADWMASGSWEEFLKLIKEVFLEGSIDEPHFESLTRAMSDGWCIKWHGQRFSADSFYHCADGLRDAIQPMGYTLYMSDKREFLRSDYVETIERHYLKPTLKMEQGLVKQLYGNVLIEHRLIDQASYDLRLVVQYYHDQKYQHPMPFVKLLESLCSSVL